MNRLEHYTDKLALDVVQPGSRPAELCYLWKRKGDDMSDAQFLLWDDGIVTQDNNFFGFRIYGLWSFNESSSMVFIYSTGTDAPITTPKFEFKYDPEKELLTLLTSNFSLRKGSYLLKAEEREKLLK